MIILQQTRGALSSGDQCSLDLPFAATKSLTARIGPTPTFTRGSGATYVGSDGLLHGVDTSTTSNTIGTGSKTFTLTATAGQDQLWRTGDAVDASNGSNSMVGTVTSYTPSTQVLVCNITSVTGSGTFTSWRIGYRGPRFDHDPVTLASRGLLIEEGRTNLFQRSGEYENAYWDDVTGTTCAGVSSPLAPDGSSDAAELKEAATTLAHSRGKNVITSVSGTTYTLSVFLKKNNRRYCGLYLLSPGPTTSFNAIFDLDTGTVSATATQGAANGSASIEAYGNGWYKCRVTFTAGSTLMYPGVFLSDRATFTSPVTSFNLVQYTGDVNNSVYVWGAQLEAGSFATSYIPTTTSALARSADVCSITGAAFSGFYNATEGTSFFSAIRYTNLANPRSLTITNGTSGNRTEQARGGSVEQIDYYAGGSFLHTLSLGSVAVGVSFKIAHAMAANNFAASMNGASPVVNNSGVMLTADRMIIGANFQGSAGFHNGTISAIRYYKKRLPNAKLIALTT